MKIKRKMNKKKNDKTAEKKGKRKDEVISSRKWRLRGV